MSFLFKVVLGQRVVHPSPRDGGRTGDAATPAAESPSTNAAASSSAAAGRGGSSPRAVNGARNGVAAAALSGAPASGSATAPQEKIKSPAPSTQSPYRAPASASSSPRPSTPTRTLLLRIEGCTVAQDLRDALRELLRCPDLPYALDTPSLASLLSLLANCPDDDTITEPTLQLLANATDIDVYPDQLESNRRIVNVTPADKRHTRDGLLQPLVEAVPLLLDSMKAAAPFWSRCHVVTLLQRLEEYEPSKVNQALLAARGIGALLDALNEDEHEHQLRNQALVLLTSLTLADPELQTLLAFDNAFDSLFDLIQREGGVQRGGAIVRDSLTVVHNMLRSNKATQKFFREMGCAARLAALFDAVPAELGACTTTEQRPNIGNKPNNTGASSPSPAHAQPAVHMEKLEAFLESTKSPDAMLNVLLSVSVLACVLRGSDEVEAELRATQDALLRCGLLNPLTRLAFCGLAIDDATRIEAVRVLALLLSGSKRAIEEWLGLPPVLTLVRATLPHTVRAWPTPRALLSYVCETADTTLVSAAVQLFSAVLSVPACQERAVAALLLDGLADVHGGGGSGAGAAARTANGSPKSQNGSGGAPAGGTAKLDTHGGAALARVLLSARTAALEKYYAAQVLRALMTLPSARNVAQALVQAPVPQALQSATLAGLVKAQPGWALSPMLPPSFYNYVVAFLLFCLGGGAAAQQMNTAAIGAYVGALLSWMAACPLAAAALVEETAWGEALLHQARRDGAAHLRLWSAVLIASAAVVATRAAAAGVAPASAAAAAKALTLRFLQLVGSGAALDTILFDAQASTPAWQHPAASGLRTQNPSPYDEALVAQVEQLATEFKQLLTAAAGSAPPGAVSMPPLVRAAAPPVVPPLALTPATAPPGAVAAASSMDHSRVSSGDYRVEDPHPPPPQASAPATIASPSLPAVDPQMQAMLAALQAELAAAKAERAGLAEALDEWRTRAEQSAAQCASMQEEHTRRTAAAAEAERLRAEEATASAAHAAHSHAASADVVDGLRENIRLLEEALSSKEEEHQQLVESLNMMEDQLRHASQAAAQRQQQLQQHEEREARRSTHKEAPPPSPPPSQPAPQVVAALEAERNAVLQQLALTQRETARLQQALRGVSNDYSELLVMVAELNDECVSVKEESSMAVTPARPWQRDGTPSLERMEPNVDLLNGDARQAEAAVYDADMTGEAFFGEAAPPVAHAPQPLPQPLQVQALPEVAPVAAAAETALSHEPSWAAGATVNTYEEATDVTIGTTATPTSAQMATAPPPKQSASPEEVRATFPNAPALPASSLLHAPSATGPSPAPPPASRAVEQVAAASPGPPPPPRPHAPQHPPHRSALHAPRYADPSAAFFGGAPSAPAPAALPAHQPPRGPPLPHASLHPGPQTVTAAAHHAAPAPPAHPLAPPPTPLRQSAVANAVPATAPVAGPPRNAEAAGYTAAPQLESVTSMAQGATWQPSASETTTAAGNPFLDAAVGGDAVGKPFAADGSDDDGDGNGAGDGLKPPAAPAPPRGAAVAQRLGAQTVNHQRTDAPATQESAAAALAGTETAEPSGTPTSAFNPFADFNGGDGDGDDEFGDLR